MKRCTFEAIEGGKVRCKACGLTLPGHRGTGIIATCKAGWSAEEKKAYQVNAQRKQAELMKLRANLSTLEKPVVKPCGGCGKKSKDEGTT